MNAGKLLYDCPMYGLKAGDEIEIYDPRNKIKIGDTVKMNDKYYVHEKYRGVIWKVNSNPWKLCGTDVVKLDGYPGGYAVDGLDVVKCQ